MLKKTYNCLVENALNVYHSPHLKWLEKIPAAHIKLK